MKSIIFDNKLGNIPYKAYNCSIIKLNNEETVNITNKIYDEESILITFFVSLPGKRFGTMSWIGLLSYQNIIKLLDEKFDNDNLWLIKPHLLQNDKGPKCADLRIFKMKENFGVIGYTRLASKSNTQGIADYYVRASILDTKTNNELFNNPKKLFDFKEIDGGCFPSKIGNNYEKFKIINDTCKVNSIEFYIKDNAKSKLITPHKSKNKMMPNEIKLNGIEVSFSKTSTNESHETHISTKNIIPVQHNNYLNNIGCFIDFSPPNSNNPLINIQNMLSGKVYYVNNLSIPSDFICKKYRGSTPYIQIDNEKWITIVHKRIKHKNKNFGLDYKYILLIFNSKNIFLKEINLNINIPNECQQEIELNIDKKFNKNFIYITGLILTKNIFNPTKQLKFLEMLVSYGISDSKSGICKLEVSLDKSDII